MSEIHIPMKNPGVVNNMRNSDLFTILKRKKKISANLIRQFQDRYGKIFFRALDFLQNEGAKVTKYEFQPSGYVLWTIAGSESEYLLYPDEYCQCQNFLINSIYRKRVFYPCKHLLAQKLAEALDQYKIEKKKDKEYKDLIKRLR
ncbi:MAG: hypothetical protein ACTSVU_05600 [Promethearchaeota archaeon]